MFELREVEYRVSGVEIEKYLYSEYDCGSTYYGFNKSDEAEEKVPGLTNVSADTNKNLTVIFEAEGAEVPTDDLGASTHFFTEFLKHLEVDTSAIQYDVLGMTFSMTLRHWQYKKLTVADNMLLELLNIKWSAFPGTIPGRFSCIKDSKLRLTFSPKRGNYLSLEAPEVLDEFLRAHEF